MNIREYQSEDRKACIKIFQSNIPKFFLPEELVGFEEFLDKMAIGAYWVLEDINEILACGGIGTRNSEGRLHFGMVLNSCHHKGIGSHLMKFRLAQLIKKSEVKAISLDTSQHNPDFFRRFGFLETSVKQDAYGPGLHRHDMRWELPEDEVLRASLIEKLLSSG